MQRQRQLYLELRCPVLCCVVLCCVVVCYLMLGYVVLCCVVMCCVVLWCVVLCCVVLHCIVLWCVLCCNALRYLCISRTFIKPRPQREHCFNLRPRICLLLRLLTTRQIPLFRQDKTWHDARQQSQIKAIHDQRGQGTSIPDKAWQHYIRQHTA